MLSYSCLVERTKNASAGIATAAGKVAALITGTVVGWVTGPVTTGRTTNHRLGVIAAVVTLAGFTGDAAALRGQGSQDGQTAILFRDLVEEVGTRQDSLTAEYRGEMVVLGELLPVLMRVSTLLEMAERTDGEWVELGEALAELGQYVIQASAGWSEYQVRSVENIRGLRLRVTEEIRQATLQLDRVVHEQRSALEEVVEHGRNVERLVAIAARRGCALVAAPQDCAEEFRLKHNELTYAQAAAERRADLLEEAIPARREAVVALEDGVGRLTTALVELDASGHQMRWLQDEVALHIQLTSETIHSERVLMGVDMMDVELDRFRGAVAELTGQIAQLPTLHTARRVASDSDFLDDFLSRHEQALLRAELAEARLSEEGGQ